MEGVKRKFGENKSDACGFSAGCRVTNEIVVPFCLQYCPRCGVASLFSHIHTIQKPHVHITCVYVAFSLDSPGKRIMCTRFCRRQELSSPPVAWTTKGPLMETLHRTSKNYIYFYNSLSSLLLQSNI